MQKGDAEEGRAVRKNGRLKAALVRVMMGVMALFIVLFRWPLSRYSILFFQGHLSSTVAGEQ